MSAQARESDAACFAFDGEKRSMCQWLELMRLSQEWRVVMRSM